MCVGVNRKSSGSINVIGGHAGTISRVEGRRRHSADENNIQVCFCILDGRRVLVYLISYICVMCVCFRSFQSNPRTQSYPPQSGCPSFLQTSHLHLSLLPPSAPHPPLYHHPVSELLTLHSCTLTVSAEKGLAHAL